MQYFLSISKSLYKRNIIISISSSLRGRYRPSLTLSLIQNNTLPNPIFEASITRQYYLLGLPPLSLCVVIEVITVQKACLAYSFYSNPITFLVLLFLLGYSYSLVTRVVFNAIDRLALPRIRLDNQGNFQSSAQRVSSSTSRRYFLKASTLFKDSLSPSQSRLYPRTLIPSIKKVNFKGERVSQAQQTLRKQQLYKKLNKVLKLIVASILSSIKKPYSTSLATSRRGFLGYRSRIGPTIIAFSLVYVPGPPIRPYPILM